MDPDHVTELMRQAMFVAIQVSAPLLIIAMVVGFAISFFQSVTQINEMTLTFVPKIFIFAGALMILFPWIVRTISRYAYSVLVYRWEDIMSLSNYASSS